LRLCVKPVWWVCSRCEQTNARVAVAANHPTIASSPVAIASSPVAIASNRAAIAGNLATREAHFDPKHGKNTVLSLTVGKKSQFAPTHGGGDGGI
jgi:hypothetical protein